MWCIRVPTAHVSLKSGQRFLSYETKTYHYLFRLATQKTAKLMEKLYTGHETYVDVFSTFILDLFLGMC